MNIDNVYHYTNFIIVHSRCEDIIGECSIITLFDSHQHYFITEFCKYEWI